MTIKTIKDIERTENVWHAFIQQVAGAVKDRTTNAKQEILCAQMRYLSTSSSENIIAT